MSLTRILAFGFLGLVGCTPRNLQLKQSTIEEDVVNCYDNPNIYNDNAIIHCDGRLKDGSTFVFQRNLIVGKDGLDYAVDILTLLNRSGLTETYLDANNYLGDYCPTLENPLSPSLPIKNGICEAASINSPVDAMGRFKLLPHKFEFHIGSGTHFGTDKYIEIKERIFPKIPYGPFNRNY